MKFNVPCIPREGYSDFLAGMACRLDAIDSGLHAGPPGFCGIGLYPKGAPQKPSGYSGSQGMDVRILSRGQCPAGKGLFQSVDKLFKKLQSRYHMQFTDQPDDETQKTGAWPVQG